ncbi:MAG: lipid-binding SYLF domain-containing protein [Gammaproteobacteria bacterium]|nr:MAG: lipid-binding SYLF domain-containing protein [Gammaproteobacteria bacterium]
MSIRAMIITLFAFLACSFPVFADSDAQDDKDALKAFKISEVVSKIHKSAYGYAIFPNIGKGGFGIGAAHGSGRVYKGGKKTGDVSMTQISIGFQVGGQTYRQVIYFQDKRAFDDFTSGEFEFGAQAEAIAITSSAGVSAGSEGTSASANATQSETKYHKGMIVFTMGKGGLMYQAALGGQKYNYTPSK